MKINLLGAVNPVSYGIVTTNVYEQLADDHDVALFPICQFIPPEAKRKRLEAGRDRSFSYDPSAPSVKIWYGRELAEQVGRGQHVGFPFFELDQLLPAELHHMGQMDHVCVASDWARRVCEDSGLTVPVSIVNLGVDREIFNEDVPHDRFDPDYTVFVNVGKWELRKGHDVLLRAFNKAFERSDKVLLKMLTYNPFIAGGNEQWARQYSTTKMSGNIIIERGRFDTQQQVAQFMTAADAAVFPARAEAWNLDLLECMACGLHCIATNYSGHTEYVDASNCMLIQPTQSAEREIARDNVWFHGDASWMKFGDEQEEQLINYMRDIHRLKQTGDLPRRNEACIETSKRFTWKRSAETMASILRA